MIINLLVRRSERRFISVLAFFHRNVLNAGAERAGSVGAGAVDVLTVGLFTVDVAVEHGGYVRHPPVGTSSRLVVVSSLNLSIDFRDTRLNLFIGAVDRG